ncbi:FAD-dependent oxidoreductase [Hymenobacter sp. BT175]|uniref:NAD(P)/FAD-dependent oxidoreductase n=1 Tax=Hymenobacter translucens TaxID=2886507 RepID=UPI001D0F33BC|nr:FAD-dependent oxidoreductase [Hymenobacter translucens]MCC2545128.1 FAD-dependent oxidoreductase [Hymenobacter translucens]
MHLVIIGNGITGVTAALTVRRRQPGARITLVSDESAHHYSRTALMYVYMGHMRAQDIKPYEDWFWSENRLELIQATATGLDTGRQQVHLSTGVTLAYDKLLLATGSVTKRYGWPGQNLRGVQGLYGLPDLARMEQDTRGITQAVVVGGGLIGVELAEMLHTRGIHVTMLVREARYWGSVLPPEEARLVDQQLTANGITVRYQTELAEVLADADGRVRAVRTTADEELPAQWLGIATGVAPNLSLVQHTAVETDRGILVNEQLETSVPGVYAAGDCAQHRQAGAGEVPIEQLWYTGRMQGETVGHTLAGQPTPYRRGIWFNSAKFFNLEYQTYGQVPARPAAGSESFYWEPANGQRALRINFDPARSFAVTGFNALGLRLRHDVCEAWLREQAPVQTVVAHLGAANFDPEFYRQHEPEIVAHFNRAFPQQAVQLRQGKCLISKILNL